MGAVLHYMLHLIVYSSSMAEERNEIVPARPEHSMDNLIHSIYGLSHFLLQASHHLLPLIDGYASLVHRLV